MTAERWQQIERLFSLALERDPAARSSFLKEACGEDESLRKEIESLLASSAGIERFMESPAIDAAAKALARDRARLADLVGHTVAHFRIVDMIGAGGMGEVYRARDERLKREVAVKVLPEIFAADPERVARLDREARLLASISHPNVASIHGLEEVEGKRFLVLELVEGETLAQRLTKGPLPLDEALEICRQIAEGVEAAHEKGIIHRDLKPANIKITAEGRVKVLDFGLAKALSVEPPTADLTQSPTITAQSHPGILLGTAAYMSPEQVKGKQADKRSDVWSFGCVLFECVTGKRAFEGETVTETLGAILKNEPDCTAVPPALRPVLRRCLAKDPGSRLHDIADARILMAESAAREAVPMQAVPAPWRLSLVWLAACAAVMLLAGILIGPALMRYLQPAPPASMVMSTIRIETGHWLGCDPVIANLMGRLGLQGASGMQRPSRTAVAISSNGSFIVYSAVEENPGPQAKSYLYVRRMDQSEAQLVPGTEGGINPFLSPDNRWVGFWADGKLKKVPIEGGVATALCDASLLYGANWGRDNSIVFAAGVDRGISRVSAEGGTPEILTKPDPKREEYSHRLPSWLPNGKAVVFTVMRHGWDTQPWLALLRMDTREWHVLLRDAADARYVSTGHLVFLQQGRLMAVRFDPAKPEVIGQPVALVDNVMQTFTNNAISHTGAGQFGISDTGSLIYAAGGIPPDQTNNSLVWVDQKGTEQPATALQLPFSHPRLSPDGRRIAYQTLGRERQVWVYDLSRGTNSRLTGEEMAVWPIWAPDGKRLLFLSPKGLIWQPYDESSPPERLATSEYVQFPGSWSPDGETIALVEFHPDTGYDIALLDVHSGRVTSFLNSQFLERYPEFSPDGRWIAYTCDESKGSEVYLRPFPGPGIKYPVSIDGGTEPRWARNGKQLFYRNQYQMWVVDVETEGGVATGKPRLLFEKSGYLASDPTRSYDLSLDGQRFLMVKGEQRKPTPVTELILVQNWLEELKRLVPVK